VVVAAQAVAAVLGRKANNLNLVEQEFLGRELMAVAVWVAIPPANAQAVAAAVN
jgi:hypothetical protein